MEMSSGKVSLFSFLIIAFYSLSAFSGEESDLFFRYSVTPSVIEKTAEPNLSSYPDARLFASRITYAMQFGPNFSGEYTLASWGCGTNCSMAMIISARTGNIQDEVSSCGAMDFRLTSNLLIINPKKIDGEVVEYPAGCQTSYLLFEHGKFSDITERFLP